MTDALGVPQLSPWEKPRSSGGIRAFPKVTAEAPSASATPSQPGLQAGSKQTLSGLLVFSLSCKPTAWAEHVTWHGLPVELRRPRRAACLSARVPGAGITVFLDPPAVAKASGVWRRRAGLLA